MVEKIHGNSRAIERITARRYVVHAEGNEILVCRVEIDPEVVLYVHTVVRLIYTIKRKIGSSRIEVIGPAQSVATCTGSCRAGPCCVLRAQRHSQRPSYVQA